MKQLNSINNKPTCDNECDLFGWSHEYIITKHSTDTNYHVSVHPGADITGDVLVFNHDIQQCITIGAYNYEWDRIN